VRWWDAGVATLMTSFSDVNGVPATATASCCDRSCAGVGLPAAFVVSDWNSIQQLSVHGLTAGDADSAYEAATAGVDMDMGPAAFYAAQLVRLVEEGRLGIDVIDAAVAGILRLKFRPRGLFDGPYVEPARMPAVALDERLRVAKRGRAAERGPGSRTTQAPAALEDEHPVRCLIGPLADEPYEQLGTVDLRRRPFAQRHGPEACATCWARGRESGYVRGLETSRSGRRPDSTEALDGGACVRTP